MSIKEEDFELDEHLSLTERYLGLSIKTFLFLTIFVILMGIYIGIVLYGKNSINVLLGLQNYESYLQDEIQTLKEQNAKLQKEYFELKEISGEADKK